MSITIEPSLAAFERFAAFRQEPAGLSRWVHGPEAGRGLPILAMVHGGYHGAWCYANYLEYFGAHGIPCAALDLPGHGGLAPPPDFAVWGVREYAEALQAALAALPGPAVLIGHSVGALPVLAAATQAEVAAVALLAPSPPANLPGVQAVPPVPDRWAVPAPDADEVRRRFLAWQAGRDVGPVLRRLCAESPALLNDRYLLRVAVDEERLRGLPGLCIEAGLDEPPRHPQGQDRALAAFLGFSHVRLGGQPHCMMYADGWQTSADLLLAWYRSRFI